MLIPFTQSWKNARLEKAESAWQSGMDALRQGDPDAEARLEEAINAGVELNFLKANQILWPPHPQAMKAFLRRAPTLHPNAGWAARGNDTRDTLLHFWAQSPEPVETSDERIEAMTALLWHPPTADEEAQAWPTSQLSPYLQVNNVDWWGNRRGITPRMFAAAHGHWPLLSALAWPLEGVAPELGVLEEDKQGEHWVDHWVNGLLARQQPGLFSPAAEQAARKSDDFARLLLKSNSHRGPAAARLWASGVPIHTLLEWIAPAFLEPKKALAQALLPQAYIRLADDTETALVLHAPRTHSLDELRAWAALHHTHGGPFIEPLGKRTAEKPPSIAATWAGEALVEAIEQQWLSEANLVLKYHPALEAALHQAHHAQEPWFPRLLDGVAQHYPQAFHHPHRPYSSWKKAWLLENTLPSVEPARVSPRF